MGIQPGAYPLLVSVDGGSSFLPAEPQSQLTLAIKACPGGSVCDQKQQLPCPAGHYCPQSGSITALRCPLGAFAGVQGAVWCDACPVGAHCPDQGLSTPRVCPPGSVCLRGATGSLNQLEPCPAGLFCALRATPQFCPDGAWCPEGTATAVAAAGNFSSPQPCRDGASCLAPAADSLERMADP
jgi:hypothetical protein